LKLAWEGKMTTAKSVGLVGSVVALIAWGAFDPDGVPTLTRSALGDFTFVKQSEFLESGGLPVWLILAGIWIILWASLRLTIVLLKAGWPIGRPHAKKFLAWAAERELEERRRSEALRASPARAFALFLLSASNLCLFPLTLGFTRALASGAPISIKSAVLLVIVLQVVALALVELMGVLALLPQRRLDRMCSWARDAAA
jgi:hypothetical protein